MAEYNTWPGWTCVDTFGKGSFGKVYKIEKRENGTVKTAALKVVSIPLNREVLEEGYSEGYYRTPNEAATYYSEQIEASVKEFEIMAELRGNRNIVHYEGHMLVPHQGWPGAEILMRMEALVSLDKYQRDHPLPEKEVIRMGIDVCRALEACHEKTPVILHRDIKPANIMVDMSGGSNTYKLGDFGVARVVEGTRSLAHTVAGSTDYMAPEVQKGEQYGRRADLYSLGMTMYRYLNGNRAAFLPASGTVTPAMREEASRSKLSGRPVPEPRDGSPALKSVIMKALAYDPDNRWQSAAELRRALERCLGNASENNVLQPPKPLQLRCPHCGADVDEDDICCGSCGGYVRCPHCGASLIGNEPFCGQCGRRIGPEPAPAKHCPHCGSILHGDPDWCPACGAYVRSRPTPPTGVGINPPETAVDDPPQNTWVKAVLLGLIAVLLIGILVELFTSL